MYVLWPLDFQIQKRTVPLETKWGNMVFISIRNKKNFSNAIMYFWNNLIHPLLFSVGRFKSLSHLASSNNVSLFWKTGPHRAAVPAAMPHRCAPAFQKRETSLDDAFTTDSYIYRHWFTPRPQMFCFVFSWESQITIRIGNSLTIGNPEERLFSRSVFFVLPLPLISPCFTLTLPRFCSTYSFALLRQN